MVDLYNPQLDTNVDKILHRREQRQLARYQQAQLLARTPQRTAHELLLGPTPRPTDNHHQPPPNTNTDTKTPEGNAFMLLNDDQEPALDWTKAEIQALRNQVHAHKRIKHPPPPKPMPALPPSPTPRTPPSSSYAAKQHAHKTPGTPATPGTPGTPATPRFQSRPSTTCSTVSTTSICASAMVAPSPVRTHTGTSYENKDLHDKRKKWQSIAKALRASSGWYGRNYCECQWVWRLVKKRQAKADAKQALKDQERLKIQIEIDMVAAKTAHLSILTTGGGETERPWTEEHLKQLEVLIVEFPSKMFQGDKRARWKRIQAEMGLPDRSYKACQKASKHVARLKKASQIALDTFDTTRKNHVLAQIKYKENISYLTTCNTKLHNSAKLISFQRQLDRQLINVARIVIDELDLVGRPKELSLLLKRGADPNASDRGGYSALMAASRQNACGNMQVLLEFGADIDLMDSDGNPPIMHAIEGGAAQAVLLLLQQGARLSLDKINGMNAPGVWSEKIQVLLHDFVQEKQQSMHKARTDRKWFQQFEAKMKRRGGGGKGRPPRSGGGSGGGGGGKSGRRTGSRQRNGQWPPKVPLSGRQNQNSRGSIQSRGSTALPVLLQAPSALEALRLGLEGSSQAKKRIKRDRKEKERQELLAEHPRPPTHELTMFENRLRASDAVEEGQWERHQQTNALTMEIGTTLHRASTAGR